MAETFSCPMCGAPLQYPGSGETVSCPYCSSSVIVPPELRSKPQAHPIPPPDPNRVFITPEQKAEIVRLLRDGKKIEAIKIYRQATTLGLKEAKDAVEAIQAADPELKDKAPEAAYQGGSKIALIAAGLFFLAIASIFPIAFFPMGIQAWQVGEYVGSIFAFLGAIIWLVIWGGIGVFILLSMKS